MLRTLQVKCCTCACAAFGCGGWRGQVRSGEGCSPRSLVGSSGQGRVQYAMVYLRSFSSAPLYSNFVDDESRLAEWNLAQQMASILRLYFQVTPKNSGLLFCEFSPLC